MKIKINLYIFIKDIIRLPLAFDPVTLIVVKFLASSVGCQLSIIHVHLKGFKWLERKKRGWHGSSVSFTRVSYPNTDPFKGSGSDLMFIC